MILAKNEKKNEFFFGMSARQNNDQESNWSLLTKMSVKHWTKVCGILMAASWDGRGLGRI